MPIPELHIGHSKYPEKKDIIVRNTVYNNETELERSSPHRHNFFEICLINQGSGIHVIDFEEFEVKSNRLFLVSPLQVHFWKLSANTNISLIQFSEQSLNFLNDPGGNIFSLSALHKSCLDLNSKQAEEIFSISQKLEKETLENDAFSNEIIHGYLLILSRFIERISSSSNNQNVSSGKKNMMTQFQELLEKHFQQNKNVSFYANELNITPNYLNMLCKKQFGRSAGQMITKRITLEAKRLLYHTTSDISQIAFDLGFDDPSYFTRSFKRSEGITPTQFKEKIYKKYQR